MGVITFSRKKIYFIFLLMCFFSGFDAFSQCPTITNPNQSFCDLQAPTVSNLAAVNNGGGIAWYATSTSTTPLSGSAGLANGVYYVDSSAGNCTPRPSVTVTVYGAPTGLNFQGVCVGVASDATIADLIANGNNIQWYATAGSTTSLPLTTVLNDNTIYYASQTNPNTGCETSRLSVFVNVGVVPVPTGPALQQFCNDPAGPAPTVNNLVASGANNWYLTDTSASPLDPSTPLINGQHYFATTVDPPCESVNRLEVTVELMAPNDAGNNAGISICQNQVASTPPFSLFNLLGGSPDTNGTWTGPLTTTNGHIGTVNISTLTLAGSPYVFTYTAAASVCPADTSTVTITILPLPTVSISGNSTICSGSSANVVFTGTPNATVTYNINGGPNQTIVLTGSGTATLTNTYTANAVINIISVASAGTPSCSQTQSGSVTITVLPLPNATIASNVTICSGGSATVTFTGTPNSTVTYSVNGGPNTTIGLNSAGTATITNTYTATTTFTLVSISSTGTPVCTRPLTGSVTVTVIQLPIASIASNVNVCPNGSATVTFTGTPNATVTYTVNGGPNQTIVLNAAGSAAITGNYTVTTVYTLVSVATSGTPSCTRTISGTVTVTVLPLPVVTIASNSTICSGGSATVTFTGTPNATVTYTVNGGLNQTIVLNGSGTATITNTYTATTVFSIVSVASAGTPSCSQPQSGSATITVVPLPTVSISATPIAICSGSSAVVTFTGTPGATVTYSVNGGVNQTIVLNASGTATISNTYTATTVFTLISATTAGTPSCTQPQTGTITINVTPLPTTTVSSSTSTICSGGSATVTFTGTPNATVTYTINSGPNQTIVLNGAGTAVLTNTYTASTIFTIVSVATTGTPACSQPQSSTITINVVPLPTVTISPSTTVCSGGSATVTFAGTPNSTVTYNINGGPSQTIQLNSSGTASITGTFSATTIYNLVSVASAGTPSCSQPQSGSMTITVVPLPVVTIAASTTICSGGSATVTFTGTANATVTYTVNGGPNQTITLNGSGSATITGTYTSTTVFTLVNASVGGASACSQPQTGSVTITVIQLPTVTITGNTTVCPNSSATITFNGTPNATVTYTINGGPNQSIVLNGSGIATVTGTFAVTTVYSIVNITTTGTPACSQPASGTATVTVLPLPTATIAANTTICSGDSATVAFTGTPNATVTYSVNNGPNQTIVLDTSGNATLTNTYTSTTTFTLISVATSGTPGCSQPQSGSVIITVIPPPVVAISGTANVCPNGQATVTFIGTPNAIVTYTVNGGADQTVTLDSSGNASITANYSVTTVYTLVGITTSGANVCTQPQTGSVTVTVLPLPVVAISSNTSAVCSGNSATVTFTGTPNATVTYTTNGGNPQTIVLNASGTASVSGNISVSTTYSLVSASTTGTPSCSQPQTGTVTINAVPPPEAGVQVVSYAICTNDNPVDLFTLLGPTAQLGGTWSPALSSGNGIFNPAVDTANTFVYTVTGIAPCPNDSASVTVSVVNAPVAGNDSTLNICSNADPVNLFTLLGNAQPGGTWTPTLASGNGVFNPAVDVAGNYTYTVSGMGPCDNDTATVAVTITPGPDAGQDGNVTLCVNSQSQDLFNYLNGTPQVGGVWSPALASGTGVFNPTVDAAGVYTYTFFGNQPCDNDTATVTVTVNPIPNAGTDGTAFFCSNYPASDLFPSLGGSPQTGGTWSPALASGTGVFNPLVDAPGTYTYSVGGNLCSTSTATVTVTVVQSPNAGGVGATLLINACLTTSSVDLFTALNGQQGIGTWNDDDNSGALNNNIFNPSAVGAGTYHFTYTVGGGVSPCLFDSATVTVIVDPQPNAGTFTGAQSVCASNGTFDLSTLLNNEQTGGVWTDINNQTVDGLIDVFALGQGTFDFTYTISNACGNDTETVQLTVLPNPVLTIPNITLITPICLGDNASITLTGLADGQYTIIYNLTGTNNSGDQTANVTITGGTGNFYIGSGIITNTGTTTITFVNITNTATNCFSVLSNVLVNFVVAPLSNLENVNLSIASVCFGSDIIVVITNATGLSNGNYQFNYILPQATPPTGSTGIITVTGGNAQFTVPASYFLTEGTYSIVINNIINLSTGCSNLNETAFISFQILPTPDTSGAQVAVNDGCVGFSTDVSISGANNLSDGVYTLTYQLSGANTASTTITVAFTGGSATFDIPSSELLNEGAVNLTITQFSSPGPCGADVTNFNPVTFTVSELGTPVLNPQGNEFCAANSPTIASLTANVAGTNNIVWYNSASGGTAYNSTDALVGGTTYYGAFISASGCGSAVRLEVTVDLKVCDQDIIIPDGFSPNGDMVNDEFVIVNLAENYPQFKLEIYNRYGSILYKGNSNSPNWNGTASEDGLKVGNGAVPVGVYFYIIEFNDGAKKPIQGRLYLSR